MDRVSIDEVKEWIDNVGDEVFSPYDIEILKFLVEQADELEISQFDDGIDAVEVKVNGETVTWSLWDGFEYPHEALHALWVAVQKRMSDFTF